MAFKDAGRLIRLPEKWPVFTVCVAHPLRRWRLAIVACCLLGLAPAAVQAGFPKSPYYPNYKYPSVLDAPRGYGPTPVYGFAGPSYRWGWFGAQYRPRMVHHTGSQNDYSQTGFRWGY